LDFDGSQNHSDPDVLSYLCQENAYTDSVMSGINSLVGAVGERTMQIYIAQSIYLLTIYKNRSPLKFHNHPRLNAQSS